MESDTILSWRSDDEGFFLSELVVLFVAVTKFAMWQSIRRATYFAQCCTSWKMMNSW
jgi:hypothetical protein